MDGNIVKCPKHGARFDVRTGEVVSQVKVPLIGKAKTLGTYKTYVEGQDGYLEADYYQKCTHCKADIGIRKIE